MASSAPSYLTQDELCLKSVDCVASEHTPRMEAKKHLTLAKLALPVVDMLSDSGIVIKKENKKMLKIIF